MLGVSKVIHNRNVSDPLKLDFILNAPKNVKNLMTTIPTKPINVQQDGECLNCM